jgi:undecaprenyl-phosphate 4-deoxy-4-formamido-L-arabinose transferase
MARDTESTASDSSPDASSLQGVAPTVVIPVFNGAATIGPLVERLVRVFEGLALQVVLVNDGSTDASHEVCLELSLTCPCVTYVLLARNFGEHNAVMAGLAHAEGDYVLVMDDDFQNPPEEALRMLREAVGGDYDVVYARYRRKRHGVLRNLGSRFNDLVASFMLGKPRDLYLSSFKCMNRFLVREILKYRGASPYIDGLILRCTRSIGTIEVRHEPRGAGRSGYTPRKLLRLWLNMFVNFSIMPLRVSTLLGVGACALSIVLSASVVIEKLARPDVPIGWPSVVVIVMMFSGVQLLILGVIGEYVGRIFLDMGGKPQYTVRSVHGAGQSDDRP